MVTAKCEVCKTRPVCMQTSKPM